MARGIARNVNAGKVCSRVTVADDVALVGFKRAAKLDREVRMLPMARIEEHRPAL